MTATALQYWKAAGGPPGRSRRASTAATSVRKGKGLSVKSRVRTILIVTAVAIVLLAFLCGWLVGQRNNPDTESLVECGTWECDDGQQYPAAAYAEANRMLSGHLQAALQENGFAADDLLVFAVPASSNCCEVIWVRKRPDVTLPGEMEQQFLEWLLDELPSLAMAEENGEGEGEQPSSDAATE